jgi:hypothetical protein
MFVLSGTFTSLHSALRLQYESVWTQHHNWNAAELIFIKFNIREFSEKLLKQLSTHFVSNTFLVIVLSKVKVWLIKFLKCRMFDKTRGTSTGRRKWASRNKWLKTVFSGRTQDIWPLLHCRLADWTALHEICIQTNLSRLFTLCLD